MPDVFILWDGPLFLEHMFQEYEIPATVIAPVSLNSPHLPPTKMIVVPTGFNYPEHVAVANALSDEKIQKKIFQFVENGGVFLMFSPLQEISTCGACQKTPVVSLSRFGIDAEYVQTDVLLQRNSFLTGEIDSVYCDGYFQNADGFIVVEKEEGGSKSSGGSCGSGGGSSGGRSNCNNGRSVGRSSYSTNMRCSRSPHFSCDNSSDNSSDNGSGNSSGNSSGDDDGGDEKSNESLCEKPVHLLKNHGKGKIILSSVHEFLSKTYLESLLFGPRVKL